MSQPTLSPIVSCQFSETVQTTRVLFLMHSFIPVMMIGLCHVLLHCVLADRQATLDIVPIGSQIWRETHW